MAMFKIISLAYKKVYMNINDTKIWGKVMEELSP